MSAGLRNRIWEAAQREANRLGRPITPSAEARLKSLIDQGVDEMRALGVENEPSRVREAERNIAQFVRAMNNDAQRRGQDVLDVNSHNAALAICPLFPFC